MKKKEIKSVLETLKSIKLHGEKDADFTKSLIKNHLFLLGENKKLEGEIGDLDTVYLGAYKEDREKVANLQQKLQKETDTEKQKNIIEEIESYGDFLQAFADFNKALGKLLDEEISIPNPLSSEAFISYIKDDVLSLDVIEGLYPLLED